MERLRNVCHMSVSFSFSPLISCNLSLLFGGLCAEVCENFLRIVMSRGENPSASLVVSAGQSRGQAEKEFPYICTYGNKLLHLILIM